MSSWWKKLSLYSIMIVPVSNPEQFLDLKYSKIKPNKVSIKENITMAIDHSASPLFYKFNTPSVVKEINLSGSVIIDQKLQDEKMDSYFQLGVIYAGDYRPGYFMRKILPEWLLKVIDINKDFGLGEVDFFHVTGMNKQLDYTESIRSIKLNFKTISELSSEGKFEMSVAPKSKKILGLWLRADGDNHNGKFQTTIQSLDIIE